MKIDSKLWKSLTGEEQNLLIQIAMLFPPVSLDILFHTLLSPPTVILKALEKLTALTILKPYRSKGAGFYVLSEKIASEKILAHVSEASLSTNGRMLISYVQDAFEEGADQWLLIAHLYNISGTPLDHTPTVIKAAKHCMDKNRLAEAFTYFYLVISNFSKRPITENEKSLYIEAALGLCANSEDKLSLTVQEEIATRALHYAEAQGEPELHVKLLIFKARCMMRQGDFNGADRYYSQALEMTSSLGDSVLTKWISVYRSDIEIWRGRIKNAIYQYEKAVGKLEAFPDNALFLKAYARLGWSYGICGDIYRGLGLVNVVQKKAVALNIRYIEIYAELMKLMILSDCRRVTDAKTCLENILNYPEVELDHYVLWAVYGKKAYFAYLDKALDIAYAAYRKSVYHSEKLGCPHYHGTDNLEYLFAFEKLGLEEGIFQKELKSVLEWPDIYTQGAALRYRAMYAMEENDQTIDIRGDLERSLALLEDAGAKIELGQTQIFMARYLLIYQEDDGRVRHLLKDAWETFSSVNAALFPNGLKPYLEEDDGETVLVETIVEVGNTLSQVRDRLGLLSRMVGVIIRLTGAERGGVFLLDAKGALRLESSRNLEAETVKHNSFKLSLDTIHKVIETQKESLSFGKFASLIITGQISESGWVICSPIVLRERVLGVLYMDNSLATVQPPKHKLSLLKAIGNQIAVALDNVEAYEKITRLRNQLEAETRFYRKENQTSGRSRGIVGNSSAIRKVLDTIREVAPSDATVLINGETGVGKELAAKAIHFHSHRREGPFIPINMATISPELVYSELFGHVKGAFTGAVKEHVGRFELANGGSFFMDDVDGLSLDLQVKLLRVLEEREFQKVGDSRMIRSDFRLIAATNQDLKKLVAQGKYRSDFFYRLNVVPLTIPPLRERKEDIPLLATHFLTIFSKKMGKSIPGISNENLDRLMVYDWPGNVRELSHYIERAVILTKGGRLRLPMYDHMSENEAPPPSSFMGLDEMIRKHIIEALERCRWRVSGKDGAAALLKMNPQTLYSKIQKMGLKNV